MFDFLQYDFMIRALVGGTLLGLVAPMLGTFVVARRTSLIADTLSHAALAGIGIGLLFNTTPMIGAVFTSVVAALGIEWMLSQRRFNTDAIMALFLSGGLALAVALITLKGTPINFEAYLFGSLLTVTNAEIGILLASGLVMIALFSLAWWPLVSLSFSEELTAVRGVPVAALRIILATLTALMISQSLKIVGGLLIGALMIIPVLTAIPLCRGFRSTLRGSMTFGLLSVWIGLALSYLVNIPSGSAIVLVGIALFTLTLSFRKIL